MKHFRAALLLVVVAVVAGGVILSFDGAASGPEPAAIPAATAPGAGARETPAPAAADRPGAAAAPFREALAAAPPQAAVVPLPADLGQRILVRAVDPGGEPVAAVALELAAGAGKGSARRFAVPFAEFSAQGATDAAGRFVFAVPPAGTYHVRATAAEFASMVLGPLLPGDDVVLRLSPGRELTGMVVDDEDDAPLHGAAVIVVAAGQEHVTATGADGTFRLEVPAEGSHVLQAEASGYDPIELKGAGGEAGVPLVVRLAPGIPVLGEVQDATGSPVAGAQVVLRTSDALLAAGATARTAVTDAAGAFVLEGAPRRRARVQVSAGGYATADVRFGAGKEAEEHRLTVTLQRGAAVTGRVLDPAGGAVAGASVRVRGLDDDGPDALSATTGPDGEFHLAGIVPDTRFRLVAVPPAPGPAPAILEDLVLAAGEALEGIELLLEPGGVVEGSVLDAEGAPIPYARVLVEGVDEDVWDALDAGPVRFADEQGRFVVAGLPPVLARFTARSEDGASPVVEEAVVTGGMHVLTLVIEAGAMICGIVVDAAGGPVDDALVAAHALSDAFRVPALDALMREPGDRRRNTRRGAARPTGGNAGELGQRIARRLTERRFERERNRLLRQATSRREQNESSFRGLTRTGPDGRFRLGGLTAGESLAVVVRADDRAPRYELGVQPGGPPLRFELPALLALAGRVVEARGRRPIERFTVRAEPVESDLPEDVSELLAAPARRFQSFHSPQGGFLLASCQPGAYDVTVQAAGYRPSEPRRIELALQNVQDLLFELLPAAQVEVRVNGPDGAPVRGAQVVLAPAPGSSVPGRPRRDRTDGAGRATFADPAAPAAYEVFVGPPQAAAAGPVQVYVDEGERIEQELVLGALAELTVEVRGADGFLRERTLVRVRGQRVGQNRVVRSDGAGEARFEGLLPDDYELTADGISQPVTVTLEPNDRRTIDVTLDP